LQANQILGLAPGEVFVQRNIGNLATHKDLNCMTCLEYAVTVLKVKHVIVCGHYNCGAVRGALTMSGKTPGLTNLWISDIKETRNKHAEALGKLEGDAQMSRYSASNISIRHFAVSQLSVDLQYQIDACALIISSGMQYDWLGTWLLTATHQCVCMQECMHHSLCNTSFAMAMQPSKLAMVHRQQMQQHSALLAASWIVICLIASAIQPICKSALPWSEAWQSSDWCIRCSVWWAACAHSYEVHSFLLFNHSCDAELAFVMLLCRLTELNAIRQVFNVCSSPVVQSAWDQGQTLSVHGLAYSVGDGEGDQQS